MKTIGAIIGALLIVAGVLTFNPSLIFQGATILAAALLAPSMPKPEATTSAIKSPRPPRVSAYGRNRLYGAYIFYETSASEVDEGPFADTQTGGVACDVFAVHDGEADGHELYYLGDTQVDLIGTVVQEKDDGSYGLDIINVYTTLGLSTETAFSAVIDLFPDIWTTDHRGDGIVTAAVTWKPVKQKNYLEDYPNGQPPLSIVSRWQKCPDPSAIDPSDEDQWTWTENPIRHLMHYKLVREGVSYEAKLAPTIQYWIDAAALCDSARALKAGGTEALYRSSVAHKHTDRHGDVCAAILSTCDGWIAPREDGALIVYAGEYIDPTVSIGPDEIVAFDWNGVGVDDDKAINEIVCSYVSADHDYNTVETDSWRDEDDISARGQVLSTALDPQVPSWGQVRFLAKRKIYRSNVPHRGTVTTNVAGRVARGHRYINLNLTTSGIELYNGPVEITAMTRNMQSGGLTFTWIAANPDIDEWNPATEEGDPAAKGDRIAAEPLSVPEILSAVYFETGIEGARVRIVISGPNREDLTWFFRWRGIDDVVWNEQTYSDIDSGPSVTIETGFVPVEADIEIQVSYQVGDGRLSPWSASSDIDTGSMTFDMDTETFDSADVTFDRV